MVRNFRIATAAACQRRFDAICSEYLAADISGPMTEVGLLIQSLIDAQKCYSMSPLSQRVNRCLAALQADPERVITAAQHLDFIAARIYHPYHQHHSKLRDIVSTTPGAAWLMDDFPDARKRPVGAASFTFTLHPPIGENTRPTTKNSNGAGPERRHGLLNDRGLRSCTDNVPANNVTLEPPVAARPKFSMAEPAIHHAIGSVIHVVPQPRSQAASPRTPAAMPRVPVQNLAGPQVAAPVTICLDSPPLPARKSVRQQLLPPRPSAPFAQRRPGPTPARGTRFGEVP